MAKEKILDIEPENLTDKDCVIFSSDLRLKRAYEEKWHSKGICED